MEAVVEPRSRKHIFGTLSFPNGVKRGNRKLARGRFPSRLAGITISRIIEVCPTTKRRGWVSDTQEIAAQNGRGGRERSQ